MNKIYYQDGVLFLEQVRAKIGGEDCHVSGLHANFKTKLKLDIISLVKIKPRYQKMYLKFWSDVMDWQFQIRSQHDRYWEVERVRVLPQDILEAQSAAGTWHDRRTSESELSIASTWTLEATSVSASTESQAGTLQTWSWISGVWEEALLGRKGASRTWARASIRRRAEGPRWDLCPAVDAQPNLASIHQYSIVHLSTKSNSEPTPSPIFYPCKTGEDHCSSFTKTSAKRPLPISNESAPSPHLAPIKPENERVTLLVTYGIDSMHLVPWH